MAPRKSRLLLVPLAMGMLLCFALPAAAVTLTLTPPSATNTVGTSHTVTFTAIKDNGAPAKGVLVSFAVVTGPNTGQVSNAGECSPSNCQTNNEGVVSWTYTSNGTAGTDTIQACARSGGPHKCATATKEWVEPPKGAAAFLIIDEDSIDNGIGPNFFNAADVNDDIAEIGVRSQLEYFAAHVGDVITLYTGQVGDEGWFAPETIPDSWADAGPTTDGIRNFVGNPSEAFPHNVGPGLGTADTNGDRESLLDGIPDVNPLRADGLALLVGRTVCAVVYDSDVSINYDPLTGTLKGANLGVVAFEVLSVTERTGASSSSLPVVELRILDADDVCEGDLELFTDAPEPTSSSEPMDTVP